MIKITKASYISVVSCYTFIWKLLVFKCAMQELLNILPYSSLDHAKGSCWIYDEKRFGFVLFVMGIAAKVLSVYLQSVALVYNIYNRVHKRDQPDPDISLQDVRTVPVTVL